MHLGAEGLARLEEADPDVIVTTVDPSATTGDSAGGPFLAALRARRPSTPLLVVAADPTVEGAVAALRAGASVGWADIPAG